MKWNIRQIVEAVGMLAVVLSLLLVAFEIRQANRIAVVNTEFAMRSSYHETNIALLNNPDMVEFVIRAQTSGESLEGPDKVRAIVWTYLHLNSWVATALAYENGVSTEETYGNVLNNIENAIERASPEMRKIWRGSIDSFPSLHDKPVFQYVDTVLTRYKTAGSEQLSVSDVAADQETVAVIGTGDMGDSLGPRFAKLGYRVVYGSRSPESDSVRALVKKTGGTASATSQREAAQQADIVLMLVPWPAMETVAQSLGDLTGKVVVDVSMPFKQGDDGYPEHMLETSSAEMIQGWNPGAKVVKAWATMGSQIIDDTTSVDGPVSIPIASNDRGAKEKVASIVFAMGLDPVDFGPLKMAREIEVMQLIYMIPLSQSRPENWEFYFRRSEHYGCYLSGSGTSEGIVPVYDEGDLAIFPHAGERPAPCPK